MPLTTQNAGSLVGGVPGNTMASQPSHRKVRINRAFIFEGKVREVGEEIAVPTALSFELLTARKVELAENEPSEDHKRAKAEAQIKAKAKAGKTGKVAVPA